MSQEPIRQGNDADLELALKQSLKFFELRAGGARRTLFSAWTEPIPIIRDSRFRSSSLQSYGSVSGGADSDSTNHGGEGTGERAG